MSEEQFSFPEESYIHLQQAYDALDKQLKYAEANLHPEHNYVQQMRQAYLIIARALIDVQTEIIKCPTGKSD